MVEGVLRVKSGESGEKNYREEVVVKQRNWNENQQREKWPEKMKERIKRQVK